MKKHSNSQLTAYLAGTAALAALPAQGALIYQNFNLTLSEGNITAIDGGIGTIRFDGSQITVSNTAADGGATLYSTEHYVFDNTPKTDLGRRTVGSGYLQSPGYLSTGFSLSDASTLISTSVPLTGELDSVYFGLQTTNKNFGWAKISSSDNGQTIILHQVAFESVANAPITVGVVPEPSTSLLTALAGGAVVLRRRRKMAA